MRACIEHVLPQRIDGWATKDDAPDERLTIELFLDGQVIAQTRAETYREDLKRSGVGDGRYGYAFDGLSVTDLPTAYLAGRLRVRAMSASSAAIMAEPAVYLRNEVEGFVRSRVLETMGFAEFLAYVISTQSMDPDEAARSLELLNAGRAHFPQWSNSLDFQRVGANLAKWSKRTHSQRFYQTQMQRVALEPDARAAHRAIPAQPLPDTYGTLSEWAATVPQLRLEIVAPSFFTGGHAVSFLEEAGLLKNDSSGEITVPVLAFRENAFGGISWWVRTRDSAIPVARNLYYLDFEQLRAVLDRGGFVLIDMSNEGPIADPHWMEILNRALEDLHIDAGRAILVNQNLRFGRGAAVPFRGHVAIGHYFISEAVKLLKRRMPHENEFAAHCATVLANRRKASADLLRHYICLNFTPRWFRWAMVLNLSMKGHLGRGYVSFPGKTNFKLQTALDLEATLPALAAREALLDHVPALLERCPLELDIQGNTTTSPDFDYPLELTTCSLIHIVTESEMSDGADMLRVTEKILKPIVGLQPFLLAANPGSLALLERLGFRTFGELFDQSYDAILDPAQRLDAVFAEIDRLIALPVATLRQRVAALNETLIHNFLHLMQVAPLIFNVAVENRLKRLMETELESAAKPIFRAWERT